jgi:hypothetical protein
MRTSIFVHMCLRAHTVKLTRPKKICDHHFVKFLLNGGLACNGLEG